MAVTIRGSVMSAVRTWPSTIMRRAAAKLIIGGASKLPDSGLSCGFLLQGPAKHKELGRPLDGLANRFRESSRPRVVGGRRLLYRHPPGRPRGGVVTQRSAKPCTPVQFRAWPPGLPCITTRFCSLRSRATDILSAGVPE